MDSNVDMHKYEKLHILSTSIFEIKVYQDKTNEFINYYLFKVVKMNQIELLI